MSLTMAWRGARSSPKRVGSADMNAVLATASGIGERIRELIGERPLAPLFKANTRRERQELLEADSNLPLAEVDLDDTSIETPSGASQQLQRVEVECINATPEALQPFVEQLRDAAQLEPVAQSKFRAGLDAAGLKPQGLLQLPDTPILATQPFADTQFTMLRRYFTAVLDKEPLVRAGSATAVHEMRVAARHLDVLLRLFTGYGPRWATASRGSLRALIKSLGAVRDGDVQLAYLHVSLATLGDADRAAIEPLRQRLAHQRARARARLLRWLDSNRMRAWVEHWLAQLRLGTASSARARQAITAKVARDLIRATARKLRKRADALDETSSAEAFHEVRIRAKRLRYALDAFGEPVRRCGARITWTRSPDCSTCSANFTTPRCARKCLRGSSRRVGACRPPPPSSSVDSWNAINGISKSAGADSRRPIGASGGAAGVRSRKPCVSRCAPRAPRRPVRPRPDGCVSRQARDSARTQSRAMAE